MLESLEERLTPSAPTQTAGSYTDLVTAIAADTAANTDYVVQSTNGFQFNSGEQVSISKLGSGSTLTVEGQNGTNYTLTGNGNRLFTVSSGRNVTFADLTLTGGSVTSTSGNAQGGAILDQGVNVTLSKVIVKNNIVQGKRAEGGGLYVSGTGAVVVIRDSVLTGNRAQGSQGVNGTAPGLGGGSGGSAYGGGLYVTGGGWTVTLIGDALLGNRAIGGNGGNGAAGSNAITPNTSGGTGGSGGYGGFSGGGAAYFTGGTVGNGGSGNLTILNDLGAPTTYPSTFLDNTAQGGSGGNGGAGGTSTGMALNSYGGSAGVGGGASGGALHSDSYISVLDNVNIGMVVNVTIDNTTFYANKAAGGNGGAEGAPGTGGQSNPQPPPPLQSGEAIGGGLEVTYEPGSLTIANSTVAENTVGGGAGANGVQDYAEGGGIDALGNGATVLENNTITHNTVDGGGYYIAASGKDGFIFFNPSVGPGLVLTSSPPTLINNLIQDNRSINYPSPDLLWLAGTLSNASNNFATSMSANAVSTATNIVGNPQVQLGKVVGVDANGNPTGGPIYYPLLASTISIGAGSTSVLGTIASVEGTTAANATDEIGNSLSSNSSVNLGAAQVAVPISSYTLVLTYDPSSQTVDVGSNVTFTASASGDPTPTVQWQVSTDGGKTFTNIRDATSFMLRLNNVTVSMNGYEYQAVFTNSSGSVTSAAATLTIATAPVITRAPVSWTMNAGDAMFLEASASGIPTPTVQWQVSTDGGVTFANINGATDTTLYINNVSPSMNRYEYRAVFTNMAGTAVTDAATLTVVSTPPPPPPHRASPPPPASNVPPLLAFLDSLLRGTETVNSKGTETITDSLFGIPFLVSTFDSDGNLLSVDLFGLLNITFLFEL